MTYRVVIEPAARLALLAEAARIAERRSVEAAERWTEKVEREIASLRSLPLRCPVAAESGRFPDEIRELLQGKRPNVFRILFTVSEETVSILFVHHATRDEWRP